MNKTFLLPITEPSQIGEARRLALRLAEELKWDEPAKGKVGIIVTEAATNLQKFAPGGNILLRALSQEGRRGLEILAIDKGPGIRDLQRSMQDGYSTAGTAGNGLGSIKRLSTLFDIYSNDNGTVLISQLWESNTAPALQVGAVCIPYPGELACGDTWDMAESSSSLSIVVADGLGHGLQASDASAMAVKLFQERPFEGPQSLLQRMHPAMRSTRGAAVMVVQVDFPNGNLCCSGAGNIAGCILENQRGKNLVSQTGTVGHQVAKFQEFQYIWSEGATLVLHSDGIQTRWKMDSYPGALARHPGIICALMFRDFSRDRDDITALAFRRTVKKS